MTSRIEDYALIGDCESAALVSRDGSIDWLCWPRFDFGCLFSGVARLRLRTAASASRPKGDVGRVTRRYAPDTLILETRFETGGRRRHAGRLHADPRQ